MLELEEDARTRAVVFPPSIGGTATLLAFLACGCARSVSGAPPLSAETALHLEDHVDVASIEGCRVPEDRPTAVEWRFDEPRPEWKAGAPPGPEGQPLQMSQTEDALRLTLGAKSGVTGPFGRSLRGGIYIDLPDWAREDWAYVLVRARTRDVLSLGLRFNLRSEPGPTAMQQGPFRFAGQDVDLIRDGSLQTYLMRADWSWEWEGPWRQLGIEVRASKPGSIDILSVSVLPREANYADAKVGTSREVRGEIYRRTLFTQAPGRVAYRVLVPAGGRLDVALGVLRADAPVTFRITVEPPDAATETVLEEDYADKERWAQRSVDLSAWEGRTVTLALEADAERAGAVALWAAPTLSGSRRASKPNVILYVIDGGGADYMSLYGYNRRTTPNLERIAAEGAVFEAAYSNSSWSKTSTPSFMTSLQHSVLGGYKSDSDPLPDEAVTLAQHLHRAGYQTAVFTSNAYAGTMSSLDRGVDVLREAGAERNSASSAELHENFWSWREAYPGEPYFVHFQTTDVHWPREPVAPFAGLFVSAEQRERYYEWERELAEDAGLSGPTWPGSGRYSPEAFEKLGISRPAFFEAVRSLYDETMAHNDHQIARLVERLKASGEWEHTLLIVATDHGDGHGLGLLDPPPKRRGASFYSFVYRIPMIIVWPERIPAGQRFRQPVSMIDVLPTILELADLPSPEVFQGQSLAPLLMQEEGWEPRPVILDEFYQMRDGLEGRLHAIDGRWIAGLVIGRASEDPPPEEAASDPRFTLYDSWGDRHYGGSVHEDHPDLVAKYTALLKAQWETQRALAKRFTRSADLALTPEQLRTLRALGYVH